MTEIDVYRIARKLGISDVSNMKKAFEDLMINDDERKKFNIFIGHNALLQTVRREMTIEEKVVFAYLMGLYDGNNKPVSFQFENNRGL